MIHVFFHVFLYAREETNTHFFVRAKLYDQPALSSDFNITGTGNFNITGAADFNITGAADFNITGAADFNITGTVDFE